MSTLQTYNLKHPDASDNQITFTSGGLVGVGTSAPGTGTSSYYDDLVVKNDTAGTGAGITIQSNSTNGFSGLDLRTAGGTEIAKIAASAATSKLSIDAGGSTAITVDSSQQVGIGNASPTAKLQVESTSDQLKLTYPSVASYIHEVDSSGNYAIAKDSSEVLRINQGRLLLNDNSVGTQRTDAPLQIETGSSGNAINLRARSSDNAYSYINFTSNDNNQVSASIHLLRNASNNEGSLIFSTTKGGDTAPTEQLTINSIGRMSGQAVNINRAFTLLLARLESHGGCSPGGPSGTFTEFDSGERSFTTVSRTTTTAPTNYVFFGDGYGNAFTLFVGCGDNPVFGTSVAANDAGTYRSWICIHEDFTSAISGLPTNATRTSLP
jgi:hypothetical protein